MSEKLPLSVSIISNNEEKNIGRTLECIAAIASEIIVVDSHSTDKTRDIAASVGAKVFEEDWKGHVGQKNSALGKCTQPWILMLDCDEVVNDELRQSIIDAVENGSCDSYYLNRKTFYLGKLLHHAWQPDWNLRLARRSANPVWKGRDPHDKLLAEGKKGRLDGYAIHYSYSGIEDHFNRTVRYAAISAQSKFDAKNKFSPMKLLLNPAIAFFRGYFLKGAFRDGIRGLIAAFSSALGTFLKYALLWDLYRKSRK